MPRAGPGPSAEDPVDDHRRAVYAPLIPTGTRAAAAIPRAASARSSHHLKVTFP